MKRRFVFIGVSVLMLVGITQVGWAMQAGAAHKTIWDGVYAESQASSGQAVYTQYCAQCHSTNLGGGANQGAPALKGDKFIEAWREDSLDSLFIKIRTTMPRRDPKSLSEAETLQLVAYILQANEMPTGSELTATTLPTIQIQRKDGPKPLPNYAIVAVVGCLTPDGDNWSLTNAEAPTRLRNSEKSTPDELKAAETKLLGGQTFRLANLAMLGAFDPNSHKGHKMMAKGAYSKQSNMDRISVTELEMIGATCGK